MTQFQVKYILVTAIQAVDVAMFSSGYFKVIDQPSFAFFYHVFNLCTTFLICTQNCCRFAVFCNIPTKVSYLYLRYLVYLI
jgi:hypothetical protein